MNWYPGIIWPDILGYKCYFSILIVNKDVLIFNLCETGFIYIAWIWRFDRLKICENIEFNWFWMWVVDMYIGYT